ncbi:unnamed protein product, partial [Effrenium voratum]
YLPVVDIWNLRELRPDEELVMSERYNFGQELLGLVVWLQWVFPQVGIEDVKDCLCFLTWEIAEDRTLEAWDGQMRLAIMEVTCLMSDSTLQLEIGDAEEMEQREYLVGVMQMNVGVIGLVWREYLKGILLEILETMEVLEYLLGILLEVKGYRRLVQEE